MAASAAIRSASILFSRPNLPTIDSPPVANVRQHFRIFWRAAYLQRSDHLKLERTLNARNSRNIWTVRTDPLANGSHSRAIISA
jgi:hypothetical protein